jgi:hypothetical protein
MIAYSLPDLTQSLELLNRMVRSKISSDAIGLLDSTELKCIFDVRDLSQDLADRIEELQEIFYRHKILI